ncbi:hypothetical protein [Alkaliphilus peptidifermentans]|uniref:Uncharacterized protein n=1 Tax=Alkaliphilus peptidifermentans DSM 18978 TaxID=1120976 RepID=A0A1G5DUN0_9FIRM|nr:hypothetical protein [Alkaliphilus peptidifermentans]SCY18307.1 hypothetical protein SAMN03080606_01018 [Alkaliphilus peptidifermentans DSM 18978]
MNKKSTISLLMAIALAVLVIANINDKTSLEYIKSLDDSYAGQEISYEHPDRNGVIQIYRNHEGINVVSLRRRSILGWKMTKMDQLKFNEGPDWRYIEIEVNKNHVIPLVYGFIKDDINSYTALQIINKKDNIERFPNSNLSFKTEIRGWYLFMDGQSQASSEFQLINFETGDTIY